MGNVSPKLWLVIQQVHSRTVIKSNAHPITIMKSLKIIYWSLKPQTSSLNCPFKLLRVSAAQTQNRWKLSKNQPIPVTPTSKYTIWLPLYTWLSRHANQRQAFCTKKTQKILGEKKNNYTQSRSSSLKRPPCPETQLIQLSFVWLLKMNNYVLNEFKTSHQGIQMLQVKASKQGSPPCFSRF